MPNQMNHPTDDELCAFALGDLPVDIAERVERHVSDCDPCCETIVSLASDDTFVGVLQKARTVQVNAGDNAIPAPLQSHSRYEIQHLVGRGGMGRVYQARHRMMDRTVALKVIHPEWVRKPEAIDRFRREVETAASLDHRNIVTAHDAEQAGDLHYLVMEYVDGVDLSQTVNSNGPLPVDRACEYIRQTAEGLKYAHDRGMVHRDIKPQNLMVTQDGVVKILDFGLASLAPHASPDEPICEESKGDLTVAGSVMGTPDFISPEQSRDARKVDGRSDIYSLGMTLYFLLAGRRPFENGSTKDKLRLHAEAEPTPLSELRTDLPPELLQVVARMTEKDPANRFQSPSEVASALLPFITTLSPKTTAASETPRKKTASDGSSWTSSISMLLVAGALIAAIVYGFIVFNDPGNGLVKVDVNDPALTVRLAGETITFDSEMPIAVPTGQQMLSIKRQGLDLAYRSEEFTVKRGETIEIQVSIVNDALRITKDGDVIGSSSVQIELLGHGYSRKGERILFDGKRINEKGDANEFKRIAGIVGSAGPTKQATVVDAASFIALSEEYTKDKNTVFYKWGTLERFWVVEVPGADPKSFECVVFNLAKDNKHVWFSGKAIPNADPKTLVSVNSQLVWKDANSVWYSGNKIEGADAKTFEHLDYLFYRDKNRVYASYTPLDGADPKTFRSIGDKTGYGADQNSVWVGNKRMPNVDPETFGSVHDCVYKDKDGVYCNNVLIPGARTDTIRKLADLDDQLTALLTDGESYFIFVSAYKEVYKLEQRTNSLHVSREVWEPDATTVRSRPMTLNTNLGQMGAMLTEDGWKNLNAPGSKIWGETFYDQREAKTLVLFQDRFRKAWEIISGEQKMVASSKKFIERMNTPVGVSYAEPTEDDWEVLRAYRKTQREFDGYYRKWLKGCVLLI